MLSEVSNQAGKKRGDLETSKSQLQKEHMEKCLGEVSGPSGQNTLFVKLSNYPTSEDTQVV